MRKEYLALATSAIGFTAGVVVGGMSANVQPLVPQVVQLGPYSFADASDLASRVIQVEGLLSDEGVKFTVSPDRPTNPILLSTGYELGGAHYIYEWLWPGNDPGETTIDAGAIADLWVRPNSVWACQISNFDLNPKQITLDDGIGHSTTFTLGATSVFFDVTQITT